MTELLCYKRSSSVKDEILPCICRFPHFEHRFFSMQGSCLAKSLLPSLQNLNETTPAVLVGVSKGRDWQSCLLRPNKNIVCFIRNPGDLFSHAGD